MTTNRQTTQPDRRQAMNEAFWRRQPATRPLLGMAVNITFPAVTFTRHSLEEGRVTPDMIDPEQFLGDWDASYAHTEARGEDLFMAASPYAGIPWMEAIAGCQVHVSPSSGSIWAEHPDPDWDTLDRIQFDPRNPWLLKLVECTEVLRRHAAARYPVCTPILRGVSDMAAALLGPQRMVFEFLDNPQHIGQLVARCTEIWHGVGEALVTAMGRYRGGMCAGRRRAWTAGSCVLYQDDAVSLLSPRLYETVVMPCQREILARYDRSMIHVHSGALPIIVNGLLALDPLDAVEVLIDPGGKKIVDLVELFRRMQRLKALLICGEIDTEDLYLLMDELPPDGLCLLPKVDGEPEADWLYRRLMAHHRGEPL